MKEKIHIVRMNFDTMKPVRHIVVAEKVELPDKFKMFTFYVHDTLDFHAWETTEKTTGIRSGEKFTTKKFAIENLIEKLNRYGVDRTFRFITEESGKCPLMKVPLWSAGA